MLGLLFMFGILGLIVPIAVVVAGLFFLFRLFHKRGDAVSPLHHKNWYLYPALSKEDAVSQLFLLLAVLFFGLSLLALNQEWSEPFSWRTILLSIAVLALAIAYLYKTIYTLAFGLFAGAGWWMAQATQWTLEGKVKPAGVILGMLLCAFIFYLVGRLYDPHTKWKRFALVYFMLGLIPVTVLLFGFSTKAGLMFIQETTKGISIFGSWQIVLSLVLFAGAFIGLAVYAFMKKAVSVAEVAALVFLATLFAVFTFLPEQALFEKSSRGYYSYYSAALTGSGVFWAAVFNVLVFCELVAVIFSGYARKESWLINIGMIGLFLLIGFKYFDWFFTFLDKSIFFIGAGVLLLVIGWLMEKNRRRLIADIQTA